MLLLLFHLFVVLFDLYTIWYDQQYLDLPFPAKGYEEMPFKGRLMFLTMWCLLLQTSYFILSLLNDLFGSSEANPRKRPFIRTLKDTLFGLAFTMALYVSTSFWGIYYVDKELIFPDVVEKAFPVWLNHAMHTYIILFMGIELFFTNKTYPNRKIGFSFLTVFLVSYIVWMHILQARTGAWPYPIFEVLNLPMRAVFIFCSTSCGFAFYLLGEKINSVVCPVSMKYVNGEMKKR